MDNNMFIFPGKMAVHWCVGTSLASSKATEWTEWISNVLISTVEYCYFAGLPLYRAAITTDNT